MSDGHTRVREIIDALLGPEGCPWDKKQTVESLCDYVLEEAHELVEAIRSGDDREALEELGDVAFLLHFIGALYEKQGAFSMDEALLANAAKMIRRHPHVFGDTQIDNQEQLLRNWERIKREEKKEAHNEQGLLDSVPKTLPPMLRAYRLHSKAARIGFTWPDDDGVLRQMDAEWEELQDALRHVQKGEDGAPVMDAAYTAAEREFGDYLFTLIEWGRRQGIKANAALHGTNLRFISRVRAMERLAAARGLELPQLSLDAMNELWDEVKKSKE